MAWPVFSDLSADPSATNPRTTETRIGANSIGIFVTMTDTFVIYTESLPINLVETQTSFMTTTEAAFTSTSVFSGTTLASYVSDFTYTAAPPCCSACTLFGGNVEVFYWPQSTTSVFHNASVSTMVNKAGFTLYVSPELSHFILINTWEALRHQFMLLSIQCTQLIYAELSVLQY